jgi:hypothetical protein
MRLEWRCMQHERASKKLGVPEAWSALQTLPLTGERFLDFQIQHLSQAVGHAERNSCCMRSSSCIEWPSQRQHSGFLYHDLYSLHIHPSTQRKGKVFRLVFIALTWLVASAYPSPETPQPERKKPMYQQYSTPRATLRGNIECCIPLILAASCINVSGLCPWETDASTYIKFVLKVLTNAIPYNDKLTCS